MFTLSLELLALLLLKHLVLEEFEVFGEYFYGEAVQVNRLTARLVNTDSLLLNLLVLQHDKLLDTKHLLTVGLDCNKLVIWFSLLDLEKDFENFVILVLNLNQAQLLLFILTHKPNKLAALLNLVE